MRAGLLALVLTACGGDGESQPCIADHSAAICADAGPTLECGAGTVEDNGVCQPKDHHFEIRIAETEIGANGHTRRKIVAFGTNPDGTPVESQVVIALDRASAGTIDIPFLDLGTYGAHAQFTPCNATATDCLGPATLTLALASDPSTIFAQTSINLVPDTNVSSVAPCIDHPQKFHFDLAAKRPPAIFEVDEGQWMTFNQLSTRLDMEIDPVPAANFGSQFSISFATTQLLVPMAPGIYEDARTSTSQTPNKPSFDFNLMAGICNTIVSRFQIHTYTRDTATSSLEFLASFEQLCDGTSFGEGCVRLKP